MDIAVLKEKLLLGLGGVILDTGDNLYEVLTQHQLLDIANTLSHYIPKGVQFELTNLHAEVFSNIPGRPITARLFENDDMDTLINQDVKYYKHKLFNLMYLLFIHGEDIDDVMREMVNFYRSFVIDVNDVKEEVAINGTLASVQRLNEIEVIRINSDTGKLVPTTKTNINFKNLL